jgi:hypothetical protein
LIAQIEGPGVGGPGHALKAVGKGVVAGLLELDVGVVFEVGVEGDVGGAVVVVEGVVEGVGEHAGFEAGGAEDGELGEGDALDGVDFLGVAGLVAGDGVGGEALELVGGFDAEDGVAGGEGVSDGVAGGLDFAFEGFGAGRFEGVGAVGSELFLSGHTGGLLAWRQRGRARRGL